MDTFRLDDYLLQEYGYTFTDYTDLAKQDFVEFEGIGSNSLFWIKINGEKYLLKKIEPGRGEYTWLGELLSKKIADILNIPAATYTVCRLKDTYGILSKKFTLDNETIVLGAQIIQEVLNKYPYLKDGAKTVLDDEDFIDIYNVPQDIVSMDPDHRFEYLHNNLNNLEELWSIIEIYLNIHGFDLDYLKPIMEYLTKLYMFDTFTIQGDRHMGNWAIVLVKDKNDSLTIKIPKVFDNSASFNLWKFDERKDKFYSLVEDITNKPDNERTKETFINFLYTDRLLLTPSEDAIKRAKKKKRIPNTEMLDYFLKASDSSYQNLFEQYFETLKNTDLMEILKEIEEEQHIIIPDDVKQYTCDIMKHNLLLIEEHLMRLKKGSGRGLNE